MKNKITKILLIISIIIFILGIFTSLEISPDLISESVSNNKNVDIDGSNFSLFYNLFEIFGTFTFKMLIILITCSIITGIWIIYFTILGIKRIVTKNNKIDYKKLVGIIVIIIAIILLCFKLINHNKINYKYSITYYTQYAQYNIYKMNNNNIIVVNIESTCNENICTDKENKIKLDFDNKNMDIINNFIDEFFNNIKYNTISIYESQLNESKQNIMNSIIYNNESLLNN